MTKQQLQQQRNDATTVSNSGEQRNSVAQQSRATMATAKTTEKISPTSRQAREIAEAQNLQTKIDLSPYCHNNSHVRNHLYRCVRKYRMAKVAEAYIAY